MSQTLALEVEGISKLYSGHSALDELELQVRRGEVIALVGLNGAGKSTLTRIVCGAEQPDSGKMRLGERPFEPRSVSQARAAGVVGVQQHRTVLPGMTALRHEAW